MLTIPLRRASRETAAAASCLRRLRRPYQSSQAHAADAASAEPEVSVTMSKSRTKKTVDKSQLRLADAARTSMREPFPGLPPLKPAGALEPPSTRISTIDNGLRIASQETYGPLCTFGVVIDAGSRYETAVNSGVSHLAELMAFKSTFRRSQEQLVKEVEDMGGMVTCHSSREQLLYCVDILRDNIEPAMDLLADSILAPRIMEDEVEEQKHVMALQMDEMQSDVMLKEALQSAAYQGMPLGQPHYCPPERIPCMSVDLLREYRATHFTADRMVLAGAGVSHDEFAELGGKYFAALPRGRDVIDRKDSPYTGGDARLQMPEPGPGGIIEPPLTRVALAFETGGWHDERFVPTCVLQVLLGGGDSFSAGGPGKGMHSKLYREVLNRYFWAEAAEAFTSLHTESGVLGIAGASAPDKAGDLLRVFCDHFSYLSQLESRLILFEDIGRQILSYGFRESPEEVCARIDAVTADDIMDVARRALQSRPSVAAVGADLSCVLSYEEILQTLYALQSGKAFGRR